MTAVKRLFYAIWPEMNVQKQLVSVSKQIKMGKGVPKDNLHITLLFLGQINAEISHSLVAGTNTIRGKKFTLNLSEYGSFKRSGVFWLAPDSYPGELIKLVNNLSDLAVKNNISIDERPYRPHVTLARKTRSTNSLPPVTIRWPVSNFHLVESKTLPQGANYKILHTWPLT